MSEWFEDEVFWRVFHPVLFPDNKFAEAAGEIEKLFPLIDFKGKRALDLCCGTGRHAIAMAKQGLQVTGVDRTVFLIDKAKQRAKQEKATVEWVIQDIRDFHRPGAFDLVINWTTSLGYFKDEQENLNVLKLAYNCLDNGGIAVLEMMSKEIAAKTFTPDSSIQFDDGTVMVEHIHISGDWTRMNNQWIVIKNGQAQTFTYDHTLYSGRELKEYLLAAGFREVTLYGDLDGAAYGPEASRLLAVARK